jgi:hypothetical protein
MHDPALPSRWNDIRHRRISVTEEETGFGTEHFLIEFERSFAIALEADVGRNFQM